jgi:subtilisin family serine protease
MQEALLSAKLKRLGRNLHVERQLGQDGLFRISAPAVMSGAALKAKLRTIRNFDYVEPNAAVWVQDDGPPLPDDPLFAQQYALNNTGLPGAVADADIDAPEAWTMAAGAQEVVVGEIDTGIDYNHPDLAAGMWANPFEIAGDGKDNDENGFVDDVHGVDFSNYPDSDGDPMDEHGHGTHVAGILAARQNNGVGVAGVAPNATVMALRFLRADGFGETDGAVAAINYAMDMKDRGVNVRVLNASWGSGEFSESLDRAIRNAANAGMLFVAAAGNGGIDEIGDNNDLVPFFPASYESDNIISVAASDKSDLLGRLSNYGPTGVDLAAPGLLITSTLPNIRYGQLSGTSMATPHVSATAAMLFGTHAGASWQQVRAAIFNSVDPVASMSGKTVTGGRLNAAGALRAMLPPAVVGRHVFYNASGFDGRNSAAGPDDDAAIATDKSALLPGQVGSFANYTSYSKGVNGVMADLVNPPGAIDAGDFAFAVRTASGDWSPAPAPAGVSTRAGAADASSDRVTITWADGSIKDTWLRVTVLANADTGLAQPDVFYFGNAVGEAGNSPLDAAVNALDVAATRAAQHAGDVLVDNVYDFNRDRVVNSLDLAVVRGRQLLPALPLITVPPVL